MACTIGLCGVRAAAWQVCLLTNTMLAQGVFL
jgi:hypothetical protein